MKSNPLPKIQFWSILLFLLVCFVTIFFAGCSSSELPGQNSAGPSVVAGTVFEAPLEFDAGENPLGIVSGDFNVPSKEMFQVDSSYQSRPTKMLPQLWQ